MAAKTVCLSSVVGTLMVLGTAAVAAQATSDLHAIAASLRPPRTSPAAGETFRVPVYVHDRGQGLVSYAFEVRFDPQVLQIQAIDGGTFAGFADRPITDVATFARGRTRFASVNRGVLRTQRTVNVATIVFRVVGSAGAHAKIRLERASPTAVVVKRGYEARPLQTQPLLLTIR